MRLRAILMRKEGAKSIQIQRELKIGPQTYARWVKKYNEGGKEALARIKPGNKKGRVIWNPAIFDELVEEIKQSQGYWTLKQMQSWIEKRYGKTIHLETIRYHVRKRGLSHKSARPSPYLGDEEANLCFLPSYSPQLNPVERFFEKCRKITADLIFPEGIDQLSDILKKGIVELAKDIQTIQRLCGYDWIRE